MRKTCLVTVTIASGFLGVATTATAAADYFLKIGDIKGESTAAQQPIELSSYSFGASNAGSAAATSKGGAGKVSMQDLSVTEAATTRATAPRDAASGQASGKRIKSSAAAPAAAASTEPVAGVANTLSVMVPNSGSEAAAQLYKMCANGQHIASAVLKAGARTYEMHDVTISSCDEKGGQREYKFTTGHVTLMK